MQRLNFAFLWISSERKRFNASFLSYAIFSNPGTGSRGAGRTPLEWLSRLNIAHGVAEGLTFLHQECASLKIPHGNLKSSNVLMGKNMEVTIGDFGLTSLMTSTIAAQRMAGYRTPEYNGGKEISHKSDVYCFGVLLLELLTGKLVNTLLCMNSFRGFRWPIRLVHLYMETP